MKKHVVAGNTIFIKWIIQKNSSITIENPKVILRDVFKKSVAFEYEINVTETQIIINGKYEGKDQRTFGKYNIIFYNNYKQDNQNCLVFTDCFILVHALKNKLETWSDEDADSAILVEINSDLTVSLMNQEIKDKEDILEYLDNLSNKNDEQDQRLNDISTNVQDFQNSIDDVYNEIYDLYDSTYDDIYDLQDNQENINTSIQILDSSLSNLYQELIDDEETIVRYLAVIDNSVNINSSLIDDLSTYIHSSDITNIYTLIADISTRLSTLVNS